VVVIGIAENIRQEPAKSNGRFALFGHCPGRYDGLVNIEAFAWFAGSTGLMAADVGSELKIAFKDRAALEFGVKKGIVLGTWAPGSLFTFQGFGKDGRELLAALQAEPALRRAVEERFPNATQFHVKSAMKFVRGWKPAADQT
jgi:hypothetical protein